SCFVVSGNTPHVQTRARNARAHACCGLVAALVSRVGTELGLCGADRGVRAGRFDLCENGCCVRPRAVAVGRLSVSARALVLEGSVPLLPSEGKIDVGLR